MLLALDVGNTNLTIGAFDGAKLVAHWRLRTVHEQTADEWGVLLRNLFAHSGNDIARVDGVIISSVVPPLDLSLAAMSPRYFRCEAFFVNPADAGLAMHVDHPSEVGADRVVNSVAAFHKYGGPCVIVDRGAIQQNRAAPHGGVPPAGEVDWHEHGGVPAIGLLLWVARHDRRDSGALDRRNWSRDQGDRY